MREVRVASNWEMAADWRVSPWEFTGNSWNFGFQQNLAIKLLVAPYCKEKSISIKRGSET
jgi:hypothetical protein